MLGPSSSSSSAADGSSSDTAPLLESLAIANELCSFFLDELLEDGAGKGDACEYCHILVARHPRRPQAASSSAAANPPRAGPLSSTMGRLVSQLPKWNRHTVCRTFLQRISQVLTANDVAPQQWPKVLVLLVEDVSSAEWIHTHIITPGLDWTAACQAFTLHFQLFDHSITIQRDFEACAQRRGESVQSYSDRFMDLAGQLGIKDDDRLALNHFINKLDYSMQKQYHNTLAFKQIDDRSYCNDHTLTILYATITSCHMSILSLYVRSDRCSTCSCGVRLVLVLLACAAFGLGSLRSSSLPF